MARQNRTEPDNANWVLNSAQEVAVNLLATGQTVTDTAKEIEMARQTVNEWLHYHPGFQAALHSRRQELWDGMTDRLRGLVPTALDVLERELEARRRCRQQCMCSRRAACMVHRLPMGPPKWKTRCLRSSYE
jgi:hypothetical protein